MVFPIQAILWDCDGCLIDSEYIACDLDATLLREAGYPITTDEFIRRFCGQGNKHVFNTIQKESGVDYQLILEQKDKKELQKKAFLENLKPIDGIFEVLNRLSHIPMAVASGSKYERLNFTLEITGLHQKFENRIFSSTLVNRGKPSPDIFLYAATQLGVHPQNCLVIEDSLNGVKAGKAAGMTTWGFTGGSHIPQKDNHAQELLALGADNIFHSMGDLLKFIEPQFYPNF